MVGRSSVDTHPLSHQTPQTTRPKRLLLLVQLEELVALENALPSFQPHLDFFKNL